jgi:hypothetical protein
MARQTLPAVRADPVSVICLMARQAVQRHLYAAQNGLIFAEFGRESGVFSNEIYAGMVIVIALTTILSF